MQEDHWELLVSDPVEATDPNAEGCGTCGTGGDTGDFSFIKTLEDAYLYVKDIPRDLDKHLPKLKELAEQVGHVTEFSNRRESVLALLAGLPKTLTSYNTERDSLVRQVESLGSTSVDFTITSKPSVEVDNIEETDLLFLDMEHTFDALLIELLKFGSKSTRRYIVMHDTQIHGSIGSDGGKGLLDAVAVFLTEFPEWSVIYHTAEQYGLTVLGKLKKDKPKLPSKLAMAANLAKAVSTHIVTGSEITSKQDYEDRLSACNLCDQRVDSQCAACGCFVEKKASLQSQNCPLARWPKPTAPVKS
jgi:hypothetical protein